MSEFFGSAWWLLVTLGILVTFHEFGHYWVARRCGVKVLRFSVGFGKALWSRRGRDGTEYAIGAIPLGGYVKFLDAREADNPELAKNEPGEYSSAPVWQRMAIANWEDLTRTVGEQAAKNPQLHVVVQRGSSNVPLDLKATQKSEDGKSRWVIGIGGQARGYDAIEHYGPLQAIPAAFRETWKTTRNTLGMIGSMLSGQASTKNLSSVITIAQV